MVNSNLLVHIDNTVSYIEKNIKNDIKLEDISKDIYISKFYLNRIFSVITGKKLMNYVTSRKLMSSLNELLNTDMRIVDIANEYGYSFENSFIRAFKREFGITPDDFRKKKCELKTTNAINIDGLAAVGEESILIKPEMVVKPNFFVIGDRCHVDNTAYETTSYLTEFANAFYYNKRPLINGLINEQVYYGHVLYAGKYCYYTSCIEVEKEAKPPKGQVKFQIPTNKYWVFKYVGLHPSRKITYKNFVHIFDAVNKWFDIVKQTQLPIYHFEKVDDSISSETYCELDLYFPIAEDVL